MRTGNTKNLTTMVRAIKSAYDHHLILPDIRHRSKWARQDARALDRGRRLVIILSRSDDHWIFYTPGIQIKISLAAYYCIVHFNTTTVIPAPPRSTCSSAKEATCFTVFNRSRTILRNTPSPFP